MKITRARSILILLVSAVALAGCSWNNLAGSLTRPGMSLATPPLTTPDLPGPPDRGVSGLTLTMKDGGSTVKMHVGQTLEISLPSTYEWGGSTVTGTGVKATQIVDGNHGTDRVWAVDAVSTGTSTFEVTGGPHCEKDLACPAYVIFFKVTIVVG